MYVSKTSFVCYGCFEDVFCMLWMFRRCLLYVMDVSKTSFCMIGCVKDGLFVMDASKTFFERYGSQDVFCTL